jgi:hypothetical protein
MMIIAFVFCPPMKSKNFFFFFSVLGLHLRAYTFFVKGFLRQGVMNYFPGRASG